jgi:D-lactate dehydrogenase
MGTKSPLMRLARILNGTTAELNSRITFSSIGAAELTCDLGARTYAQPAVVTSGVRAAIPQLQRDLVGAVSVSCNDAQAFKSNVYYNVDGYRLDDGRFTSFAKEVQHLIPAVRVFTDPVRTFAYGTDASFYRLNPKMVIKVHNEGEMTRLLPLARKHQVPVTFRAAGTSLSGQALTDSVLLKISHTGKNFRSYEIHVWLTPYRCECACLYG